MIRHTSKSRAKQLRSYAKVRASYLASHPLCEACSVKKSTDIHHMFGKTGPLLTDERGFLAVCRDCHNWIHQNMDKAREYGFLCQKGGWNSVSALDRWWKRVNSNAQEET